MADKLKNLIPLLTPEQIQAIKEQQERTERVKESIKTLGLMGLDVTKLLEKLDWATEVQNIMLKEFTK